MSSYRRIDSHDMAKLNKQSVMKCISDAGPISRSEIADRLGLSIPAVMDITGQLLEHGMVISEPKKERCKGKRPDLFSVCGAHYRFIGVDIGRTMMRIVMVGLDQQVIAYTKYRTRDFQEPAGFIKNLCERILSLVEKSGVDTETIVGVCVAMPGLIERSTGRVVFSPNFGWENVPLQAVMNELLPFEVIVENANRVQASWEVYRDRSNEKLTVLCIGLGYGIGGGLLQQGSLYYGSTGTCGEIGHIPVSTDPSARCTCGNIGCLEAVASGAALERMGWEAANSGKSEILYSLCGGSPENMEAKTIFDAARQGDTFSIELLDKSARYISTALAICINMLDPDRIYLCGGMMKNGPEFLDKIRKYTQQRQMRSAGTKVALLTGDPDEWNVARAAARVVPYYDWSSERLAFMR